MEVIRKAAIEAAPNYNETEVRFHIVDPVLRALGYPDSENVYLNLEEKLEYPYIHIGRRSKKDVPLGFPDYRAGLKGARGCFVVEAKAGSVAITNLEVEQAHSYAAHSQVGANYFMLCNGIELRVYQTLSGSNATALVAMPVSEINERFHQIENVLSPVNLEKNCKVTHDMGLRLCEGIGSTASIRSGEYKILEYGYRFLINGTDFTELFCANTPQISELDRQLELIKSSFEPRVSEGLARRGDDGRILAHIHFAGVTTHNKVAMQMMGIDRATFTTSDRYISRNIDSPTMFETTRDFVVPKGSMMPQLFGERTQMESSIEGGMFIKAAMFFDGAEIHGQYVALSDYYVDLPFGGVMKIELDFSGVLTLRLDL